MSLKRLFQVCAVKEAQAGEAVTGASLYTAANANFLVIDPVVEFNPEIFERANINRASLSPFSPLAGVVTGTATFQVELSGTGAATVPGWGTLLQACGMREVSTVAVVIGAVGGAADAFYNGELVTCVGSGAVVRVIHDTYDGTTLFLCEEVTGTIAALDALTGASSGATATVTAGARWVYGTSWVPDSIELIDFAWSVDTGVNVAGDVIVGQTSGAVGILQETPVASPTSVRVLDGIFTNAEECWNVTIGGGAANKLDFLVAGTSQTNVPSLSLAVIEDGPAKALKGARGTFSLAGNIGEALLFSFEFLGLKNTLTDEGTVTGVTYTAQVPPAMLGVTFNIWEDAAATTAAFFSPRFSALSWDFANSMGIGRDAGEATGVYGAAHVTSRATSGSITVDVSPEAQYDFIQKVTDGASTHMALTMGSTQGNLFKISCPSAVFTGESGGETEGIANRSLPFRVGSRWPSGVDADNCELVITYCSDSAP